jgi:hypothetical protein
MVLLAVVPMLVLSGLLAGRFIYLFLDTNLRKGLVWSWLVIGPWIFLLWLWAGHFSRPNADAMVVLGTLSPALFLLPVGGVLIGTAFLVVWWVGASVASRQLEVSITILALIFALHNSFTLIVPNLENPAQLLGSSVTSADIRTLAYELKSTIDAQTYYPGLSDIQIEQRYRYPLAWYVREIPAHRFVDQVDDAATAAIVGIESPAPGNKYKARRYQMAFVGRGDPLGARLDLLWRWFMYRERLAPPDSEGVLLLVRTR